MGNKRYNKQVPGFGYVAGQPNKGTEAAVGQIKNKICEIICRVLGITPCLCDHDCNCKKEQK